MSKKLKENYSLMFTTYPDIVDITQMRKMLGGIGISTVILERSFK